MSLKVHLVIVDPQNDFCVANDGQGNVGTLVVPGALDDMKRLAKMVGRIEEKLADIHVTLDSHRVIDISHPGWWKRAKDGMPPSPYTLMGLDGGKIVTLDPANSMAPTDEEWTTYWPSYLHEGGPTGKGVFGYLEALAAGGRYPHCIWPPHCLIGGWGHNIVPDLFAALQTWEVNQFAQVEYVTKGSNPWTEHFSGVKAEVPDPKDADSQLNVGLIKTLEEADIIVMGGEALNFCVANTARDIANEFSDPKYVEKLTLLTDATSNVLPFEALGDAFLAEMQAKGMKTSTTTDFLA